MLIGHLECNNNKRRSPLTCLANLALFPDLCLFCFVFFWRVIAGMIVFHLLMTGVLSLKKSFFASAAMLPLPVITILFFFFIQQHFLEPSMYLSLNMASGLAEASPHFLQVCHWLLLELLTCNYACEHTCYYVFCWLERRKNFCSLYSRKGSCR